MAVKCILTGQEKVNLSGDTMTGDLKVGSSSIGTNGYIEGTWLKTTKTTESAGNFATISGDGWIYKRTPANVLGDIGGQAKITANGILKGDGAGNISAANETEVELVDLTVSHVTGLQSALDGKQATITGAATTITGSNLTTNRALISDSNGKVAVSSVTSTELGYLDGVTSNIQTQLNNKLSSAPVTSVNNKTGAVTLAKGDVGLGNVDNTSDVNKPISNATQTALNGKQAKITANGILKGDGKGNITAADSIDLPIEHISNISLPTASWKGSDPYTQTVTISGSTANTKVDIQPSEEIYDQLVADNVGYLAIKNVNGTLTAVAKGGKPSVDLTVQVTYNNVY